MRFSLVVPPVKPRLPLLTWVFEWTRLVLLALRRTRCSGPRQVARTSTQSSPVLQSNLLILSGARYATERSARQRTLTCARQMPRQWRNGGSGDETLWNRCEHRLLLATPLSCRDQHQHRKTEEYCRSRRNIFWENRTANRDWTRAKEGKSSAQTPGR